MKYLGAITDPKDVVNKGYVDKAVPPHMKTYPHTQTFTATAASTTWTYSIPYDPDNDPTPTVDELLTFNAYHYKSSTACQMDKFSVQVGAASIIYIVVFYSSPTSGDSTIVIQNSFTDSAGSLSSGM